jgi:hypothetical protein
MGLDAAMGGLSVGVEKIFNGAVDAIREVDNMATWGIERQPAWKISWGPFDSWTAPWPRWGQTLQICKISGRQQRKLIWDQSEKRLKVARWFGLIHD